MGDSRRPTPSHRLKAYCTVIVRVNYGYGYTRGSGRVWVEIFGAGRIRVRVASSATGTGRVAEMVDPHTPNGNAQRPIFTQFSLHPVYNFLKLVWCDTTTTPQFFQNDFFDWGEADECMIVNVQPSVVNVVCLSAIWYLPVAIRRQPGKFLRISDYRPRGTE